MRNNNLQDELYSAYKKGHSCETALLKVMNDIQISLDSGNSVFLILLDLSAAFDLVNFDILLSRLERVLGVSDTKSTRCALVRLEHCISDVRCCMNQNRLKFNDNKTEFIVLSSPAAIKQYKLENVSIYAGDVTIAVKSSVRDLGSVIDNCVSMEKHVSSITRSVYGQFQSIGKLRRYLDTQLCAKIINCLVTSQLDFSNSLLFGLPKCTLHRLQLGQNHAARLLTGTNTWEHITPV